ncbi:transmembrane protein 115 [Exaiptasia diaphana]|uniref:Transmembrane protein 115 n=1 Tax=Exaiptasia diaphana TaxID=2652724 RepID=A0A913XJJ5_EXADI|nr:transmembrane protein 115 [Exaiptasia diaphana]KXJ20253.1 Transmembrane protein 115 [Exaiptasia diaphana]
MDANLNQLKLQINKSLGDASVVVKASCGVVCVLYVLTFIPPVWPALAVCPGFLIPPNFRIWSLITGGFLEYRIWNVVIDIIILVLCGKVIEPLWGALEFLKFVLILDVGTSLATSALCLFIYMATFTTDIWFLQFSGMTGIISGMLVAFKQISPDQELYKGMLNLRIKQLPSLVIILYTVLCLVGIVPIIQLPQMVSGILFAWVYLRFYQPRARGARGDLSEEFSCASFFPHQLQSPVRLVSNVVFNFMVKIGACSKPVRTYDVGAPSAITISLPGMDPADAERRRQRALKALNERLQKLDQAQSSWPSLDDQQDTEDPTDLTMEEVPTVIIDNNAQALNPEGQSSKATIPT